MPIPKILTPPATRPIICPLFSWPPLTEWKESKPACPMIRRLFREVLNNLEDNYE